MMIGAVRTRYTMSDDFRVCRAPRNMEKYLKAVVGAIPSVTQAESRRDSSSKDDIQTVLP